MRSTTIFKDNSIEIHHADAWQTLLTLEGESVDGIITDPPYSSGALTLAGKQASPAEKYQTTGTKKTYPEMLGDGKDQRSFMAWMTLWLTECWRIAKNGAPVLIFTDWRQLPTVTDAIQAAGFLWRGVVVWDKKCGRPMLGEFKRDCEFIVYGSKGKPKTGVSGSLPGVYSYTVNPAKKSHISEKPLQLLKDLMQITLPGGTILDPFAGSGTTALAARETGRKCIAIERSADYAKIATERLFTANFNNCTELSKLEENLPSP